jgi:hypothetical protein
MFFASIFSYAQRRRLCALAFATTRQNLRARAAALGPILARHGIALRAERLVDTSRDVINALDDPRPLRSSTHRRTIRRTTRELSYALDHLERLLAVTR